MDYYNDIWRNKIQVHTKIEELIGVRVSKGESTTIYDKEDGLPQDLQPTNTESQREKDVARIQGSSPHHP